MNPASARPSAIPIQVDVTEMPLEWMNVERYIPRLLPAAAGAMEDARSEEVLVFDAGRRRMASGSLLLLNSRLIWLLASSNGYSPEVGGNGSHVTHWMSYPRHPV